MYRKIRKREVGSSAEDRVASFLGERIRAAVSEIECGPVAPFTEAAPGIDRALGQLLVEWHHLDSGISQRAAADTGSRRRSALKDDRQLYRHRGRNDPLRCPSELSGQPLAPRLIRHNGDHRRRVEHKGAHVGSPCSS